MVVGEAPGYNEDLQGKSWIGYAGQLLGKFIESAHFADFADVYLSNAARCKPPQNANVSNGQVGKCRHNLVADIGILFLRYKRVIVLACGKPATVAISGLKSLSEAFHHQGIEGVSLKPNENSPCPVLFFTYHPAVLHPKRKPALVYAVQAHFELVSRYLRGEFIPNKLQALPEVGTDPDTLELPDRVGLDIETYGILKGKTQTVFHPVQSKVVDGIDFKDQIVTVSLGYNENGHKRTHLYVWENETHRKYVCQWFAKIVRQKAILSGQNIKFDLLYLAYADPLLGYWISPQWLRVDDTMILSFLYNDQQPEKGLKELTTLYGIVDYGDLKKIYEENPAETPYDPRLHKLNCLDVAAHLTLDEELQVMIRDRYGEKSPKLSKTSADMRNAVVWCCLEMERVGCAMDRNKLQEYHEEAEWICAECENYLRNHGVIPEGTGSDKSKRELIAQGLGAANLLGDKRIEFTPKAKKLAFGQNNTNLILEYLAKDSLLRPTIETFKRLEEWSKVIETYTGPLLDSKKKGMVIDDELRFGNTTTTDSAGQVVRAKRNGRAIGITFPSWYPVPSYSGKDANATEAKGIGGTKQGRITCKRPPLQTAPERIYNCITTRFNPGILRSYDFSQIELRIAALLSGDSLLLDAYQTGKDLHTETAKMIFPSLSKTKEEWKASEERFLAKTVNFLVLYRGGAKALQDTLMHDSGVALDENACADIITKWYTMHPRFQQWQGELVAEVGRTGYLEVLTGWSRSFTADHTAIGFSINDICNFKIQTLGSGQIPQSSQFEILLRLRERNLRSIIPLNVYDSILIDGPPEELKEVDGIVEKALLNPPLYGILCDMVGRSVPLGFDRKEMCRYGC